MKKKFIIITLSLLCLGCLAVGISLHYNKPENQFNAITVTIITPKDLKVNLSALTPDYYLVLHQKNGDPIELNTIEDSVIGNGLTWHLDAPMLQSEISEIELWDNNILKDKKVGRVSILSNDISEFAGERFAFSLNVLENKTLPWIKASFAAAALFAIILSILGIRQIAIPPHEEPANE